MNPKDGKAGSAVAPLAPAAPEDAAEADPVANAKLEPGAAKSGKGKTSSTAAKPYKPPPEPTATQGEDEDEEQAALTWVEVELVDEADEPVAGAKYRITMPDGTVDDGVLDHTGWVRLPRVQEGDLKITFPDLDQDAWEFIESAGARPTEDDAEEEEGA